MEQPPWKLEISHPAARDLKRPSAETKRPVVDAIDGLTMAPWVGDIKKLDGRPEQYRLRIGDWRVIFQPDEGRRVIYVVAISHRSRAYRN